MEVLSPEAMEEEIETIKEKLEKIRRSVSYIADPALEDDDILKTKKALLASEERLLKIFDNTPVGICITNENGIFELVNRAYCHMYQYEAKELIGKHFTIVVPEEYRQQLTKLHDMFIAGVNEMRGEWEVMRKDGSLLTILADAAAITGKDGRPKKVTFVMDITERKRAEILQADIERMTKHDLKSPLAGIIGIPAMMKHDKNLTEEQKSKLELIEKAGRKMLKMINMSLTLYRMETGSCEYTPERLDLIQLLRSIISEFFQLCAEKLIQVKILMDNNPVPQDQTYYINGEELLLYSMFANLLMNAIEASPKNNDVIINITADKSKEMHVIEINNQGEVPDQIKRRFFDKYTTYGKKGGSGLGTYSARLIARTHKGEITMHSSKKNGTSLFVMLPF